jgi:sugar phosphate isomerase/epimerase
MKECEETRMYRRSFLTLAGGLSAGLAFRRGLAVPGGRKMKMMLDCGSIGVRADQFEALDLASRFGFESVAADSGQLGSMDDGQISRLRGLLSEKSLVLGTAGLPVEFRKDEARFRQDLSKLPETAKAVRKAGCARMGTWIMPNHANLTYLQNLRLHRERLGQVADILADQNLRLGLEYVGPKTSWAALRYSFVHSQAEMQELIDAIGRPNVGFLLDSYHWYTSGGTEADLLSLTNDKIVSVDINDAPAGVPIDEQMDLERRLPGSTGVIDIQTFLDALVKAGFDGPVRAEPFDDSLKGLPTDEAVDRTAAAMKKVFAAVD